MSTTSSAPKPTKSGFFSRFTGSTLSVPSTQQIPIGTADGSVDEFILSGTAFGEDNFRLTPSVADIQVQAMGLFRFSQEAHHIDIERYAP